MIERCIDQLRNGMFAIEEIYSICGFAPYGWTLRTIDHPEFGCVYSFIETYNTISDAEDSLVDKMEVVQVVKPIPSGKDGDK